jgi:acyl-CoA thioesterase I
MTEKDKIPLRIMPLGDSITRGKGGSSWRHHLRDKMNQSGFGITYMGSCPHAPNFSEMWGDPYIALQHALSGNIEHEGWGGLKIHEIEKLEGHEVYPDFTIEALLEKNPSDIILLMIGTNDLKDNFRTDTAAVRLASLVQKIVSHSTAHLFISSILPIYNGTGGEVEEEIVAYNLEIPVLADARTTDGYTIEFVDMHPFFNCKDFLPDGIHPNLYGDRKIADRWFEAITSCYDPNPDKPEPSGKRCQL